jgi:hypothetical protein
MTGKDGGWVLPEDVHPDTTCFKVVVPNERQYLAAFFGALWELQYWFNWQRDDDHTGVEVAKVWRPLLENIEACGMDTFRQTGCILELSRDGGESWETIYDGAACVRDGIIDAIEDGTIRAGGQPPAGGTGEAGQCYTYRVTLDANAKWRAPIEIGQLDTIEVSEVQGGWYDGDVSRLGRWDCADGEAFALGFCQPGLTYDAGDPLPTSPHMMLIGNLAEEAAPFFPLYNTTYVVQDATPQNLDIQANDGVLNDNAGSVTFTVTICKGWCVEWDFTVSDCDFEKRTDATNDTIYVPGSGWIGSGAFADRTFITRGFPLGSVFVHDITIFIQNTFVSGDQMQIAVRRSTDFWSATYPFVGNAATGVTIIIDDDLSSFGTECERGGVSVANTGYLSKIRMRGSGDNPFPDFAC